MQKLVLFAMLVFLGIGAQAQLQPVKIVNNLGVKVRVVLTGACNPGSCTGPFSSTVLTINAHSIKYYGGTSCLPIPTVPCVPSASSISWWQNCTFQYGPTFSCGGTLTPSTTVASCGHHAKWVATTGTFGCGFPFASGVRLRFY